MRRTLVILNYQREIPPFMQNLIHFTDDVFDRILYFTPELYNDNREACRSSKLKVFECEKSKWRMALFKALIDCISPSARNQYKLAFRHKQKLLYVCRQVFIHEVCADTLFQGVVEQIEKGEINPKETVILATWFSTEAYAAAKLKKKYREFKTISYAHSFEISTRKNSIMAYDMNEFKHSFCEEIVFISEKMRELYFSEIHPLYPEISRANTSVRYLGSQKLFPDSICTRSSNKTICLLSCSGATPIKRIHLIIQALKEWNQEVELHWVHIGGGPLLETLKEDARKELAGRKNVTYSFLGSFSNEKVQKYYCTHSVDLFLNVSEDEGLPVSIMECMSYGVPAIATDVGGTSEIVTNSTGFLLDKNFSGRDLLECINAYLSMPDEDKEKLRENAIQFWKNHFDCKINSVSFLKWLSEDLK